MPDLVFDLQENLFQKALKLSEIKKISLNIMKPRLIKKILLLLQINNIII